MALRQIHEPHADVVAEVMCFGDLRGNKQKERQRTPGWRQLIHPKNSGMAAAVCNANNMFET